MPTLCNRSGLLAIVVLASCSSGVAAATAADLPAVSVTLLLSPGHGGRGGGHDDGQRPAVQAQARLAAKEVRRYVYASTRELAPLETRECSAEAVFGASPGAVLLLAADCAQQLLAYNGPDAALGATATALGDAATLADEEHLVCALPSSAVLLAGGSDLAVLYAAYRYAEVALRVHFSIGGDKIPRRTPAEHSALRAQLPTAGAIESPEFAVRGINPFHDFTMGPDFWEQENYKSYTTQMAKMRMNFIGLHNYNYYNGATGYHGFSLRHSEPTVWQGSPADVDKHGNVTRSYTREQLVAWQNTCAPEDGVSAQGAAQYQFGTAQLFGSNCHPERWQPASPATDTEAAHIAAYNYGKDFLAEVFPHARARGVRTGIGSEVPALPPRSYNTTLTYLNYFVSEEDHFTTSGDYPCEYSMVCPWMCGNKNTGGAESQCSASYDYKLPLGHHNIQSWIHTNPVPHSAPLYTYYNGSENLDGNTRLGLAPPPAGLGYKQVRVEGHIFPPNTTQAQLPTGGSMDQMYLMKLWMSTSNTSTQSDYFAVSSPTLEAIAIASGFVPGDAVGFVYTKRPMPWLVEMYEGTFLRVQRGFPLDVFWLWTQEIWNGRYQGGAIGGLNTSAVTCVVEDFLAADEAAQRINATFKLATSGWTLGPFANRSYFDKVLPEGWTLTSIDETLGDAPVESGYADVADHPSWVIPWMEDDPHLGTTQLWVNRTIEHLTQAKGYGVAGALGITWRMEAVSPTLWTLARRGWDANLTANSAWAQWCMGEFGLPDPSTSDGSSEKFAAAFGALEGAERSLAVSGCPGIVTGCMSAASSNAFAAKVQAVLHLAPLVGKSPVYQETFLVWSSLLKFIVAAADGGCVASNYTATAARVRALPTLAARQAVANETLLPLRIAMVAAARNFTTLLLEATVGPGEMGMLATIHDALLLGSCGGECNAIKSFHENYLNASAAGELAGWLAGGIPASPLPAAALPSAEYCGRERIVMGAPRSSIDAGEALPVSARVLSAAVPTQVLLHYAPLGGADEAGSRTLNMTHTGTQGRVYTATIPALIDGRDDLDFEYYVEAHTKGGHKYRLLWPAGAGLPGGAQTVVVMQ